LFVAATLPAIHYYIQQVELRFVFWILRLQGIAGWLCKLLQAEQAGMEKLDYSGLSSPFF
jgi:hypothetical protein